MQDILTVMQYIMAAILMLSVVLIPAFLSMGFCSARGACGVACRLTFYYGVFLEIFLLLGLFLGRGGMGLSVDELWSNAVIPPLIVIGCIWLMYWVKIYLARRNGWWGYVKVEAPPKSYGFPVITKQEDNADSQNSPNN